MELHPSGFIETGSCSGPRYIRSQPNRETPGVLLDSKAGSVEDLEAINRKYTVEYNLPFRNSYRFLKEMKLNWDKLSPEQREAAKEIVGKEFFKTNVENNSPMVSLGSPSTDGYSNDWEFNNTSILLLIIAILFFISTAGLYGTKRT